MNITDFRLKFRRLIRNNLRIVFLIAIIVLIIFFINQLLKLQTPAKVATTTLDKKETVIDNVQIPTSAHNEIEKMIDKFVEYCNNNEFDYAYNMLSEDCKKYGYNNNFESFHDHILKMMPEPRDYTIQAYSKPEDGMYVYNVNYVPDYLSSGLTDQTYLYTTEKMTFKKVKDGYDMAVGDFYSAKELNSVGQNDYVRVEVVNKIVKYETETYKVRIKNRSDAIAVVFDGTEANEIVLNLSNKEERKTSYDNTIVLSKGEEYEYTLVFPKYVDDNKASQTLCLNDIRIMNDYYGPQASKEDIENARVNAIAKFSLRMNVAD